MLIADGVGPRLREERERLGLTQTEFGLLLGVSRGTQKNYELGANSLDLRYVESLEKQSVDVKFVLTGKRRSAGGDVLTEMEHDLVEQYRRIPGEDQAAIRRILKAMADDADRHGN